eukprot:jgi/Tetstr1/447323/TSEL_034760.t1
MAEAFIITVLSFALVLAVIASLLVWVIMPAIKDEDAEDSEGQVKKLTLSDYIDDINKINKSAYEFDQEQQGDIEANADDIEQLQEDLEAVASTSTSTEATSSALLQGTGGVSTSNAANAQFQNGVWTISSGDLTFKSTPTEVCVNGVCSAWTSGTGTV